MMIEGSKRESIKAVIKHYQDCQLSGIKDVERQMEIYSDDSRFIVFPVASVVGMSEPRVLEGKQAIRELMEHYNKLAIACESVSIHNRELMIDPEALRGSFVMEITMTSDGESQHYLNYLQMQLSSDMQVVSSLNWQADVSGSDVFRFVN
jgi:hypothetical protein